MTADDGQPGPDDAVATTGTPDRSAASGTGLATIGGPVGRVLAVLLRVMRAKVVRYGFLVVVLALLGFALDDQKLWHAASKLTLPVLALGFVLSIGGLFCNLMVWREMLADLGSRLSVTEAWRIYFIGGLSKYVPGSIWPVLAQAELGADRGIPRSRSALSVLLCYPMMTCSGLVVAAVALPAAGAKSVYQYLWILILIPVSIILLSPPVLNRLLRLVLKLARQPELGDGVSYRGLARTMMWALAGWGVNGLMIYALLRQLSGLHQGTLLVSIGAYSLAWVAGFVAVFAPAGAGVREVVMIATLHTHAPRAAAEVVTFASRALSVLADAVTAAAAAALVGRRRLRRMRAARRDQQLSED